MLGNALKSKDILKIVNQSPGLLVAKDLGHRITAISEDFTYLLGYNKRNKLIGLKDNEVKICAHLADQFFSHDQISFKGNMWSGYERGYLKYYKDVIFYTTRVPIYEEGNLVGMLGTCYLISESKDINFIHKINKLNSKKINNDNITNFNDYLLARDNKYLLTGKYKHVVFTNGEINCINQLILGYTAKEAAKILNVSPRTIEFHLENIKSKLNCSKKSDAMRIILMYGKF